MAPPTAIVTGASSGIGWATSSRFSELGYRVAMLDIAPKSLASANCVTFQIDLTDRAAIANVSATVTEKFGSVRTLVNCAGWDRAMPFSETDEAFWSRVIDINLLGPIALTHATLPAIEDGGSIVNVASDAGRVGSSGEVVYSAAKGGLIAFSKALAREVASRHIRVNAVAPGPTDTPFLHGFEESGKLAEAMIRQTPLRKLATADDVAQAILFLASEAAGHITGQVLSVSGGLTMV